MKKNIIQNVKIHHIKKTDTDLIVPLTINTKNAINNNVTHVKIVVLPQRFNTTYQPKSNIPRNINTDITKIDNDESIDVNETGSDQTPNIIRKIFSKNIVSNLMQDRFEKERIYYQKNNATKFQKIFVNIPISSILDVLTMPRLRIFDETSPGSSELPHYFLVYILDKNDNIIQYQKVVAEEARRINDYADADDKIILDSFFDDVMSTLDINWQNLTFTDNLIDILNGPFLTINYDEFFRFIKNNLYRSSSNYFPDPANIIDFTIKLEYENNTYAENFISTSSVRSYQNFDSADVKERAISSFKNSFLENFARVKFEEILSNTS